MRKDKWGNHYYTITSVEEFLPKITHYKEMVVRDDFGESHVVKSHPTPNDFARELKEITEENRKAREYYLKIILKGDFGYSDLEVYYNSDGDLVLKERA